MTSKVSGLLAAALDPVLQREMVAPALAKGLPTFCDKPIGGTVAGTKKILDFAKQHNAPLMSSSSPSMVKCAVV